MTLLIDLGDLSDKQTDNALEMIFKASHTHGDDSEIWAQHESPFIRRLIELFTQRGLMRLDGFRSELLAWSNGALHRPSVAPVARPAGLMARWSEDEMSLVKLYLESLPPSQFTLDDHMMVVDYLMQRYMPADDLRTEAEWLATRSSLMGKVQANMDKLTVKEADTVLAALPSTVDEAVQAFNLPARQASMMQYATARCAENVTRLSDNLRHKMRTVIIEHTEKVMLGTPEPKSSLESTLLDEFGTMNRDWRRIAVTEAGENANQGFIGSLKLGTKVKRVEQYRNACAFCRKIDGKVMEVVAPDAPYKNGDTQIWTGKSNVGRSASPRRRQSGLLIDRTPDEMWWVAAGVQHVLCRGRWLPTLDDIKFSDDDFGAWLKKTLSEGSKK